jgi:hypothetical protein
MNLSETSEWVEGIYQLETTDEVMGGPEGIDNRQAKQLANRTTWLKQQMESQGTGFISHIETASSESAAGHVLLAMVAESIAGVNSSKAVTPAGLKAALNALKAEITGAAPELLNSLDEIAAALGDDPAFLTSLDGRLDALEAGEVEAALTYGESIAWNWSTQPNAKLTLTGNGTLSAPTNLAAGKFAILRLVQDATGGRVLAFASNYKGISDVSLTTDANAVDVLSFRGVDGTNCELVGIRTNVGV